MLVESGVRMTTSTKPATLKKKVTLIEVEERTDLEQLRFSELVIKLREKI